MNYWIKRGGGGANFRPEKGGPVSYSKVTDTKTNVFLSVLRFVAVIVESYKESLEILAL